LDGGAKVDTLRVAEGESRMTMSAMISADSHVQEPPEVYGERLPKRLRHRAPRIETRDGKRYLMVDGKKPRRLDVAETRINEDDRNREFRGDPTGGRDIAHRLADQERDGVAAEVIYPNTSLFLYNSRDAEYQLAVARAYNDWAIELFGPLRRRFAPVAIVPVEDVGEAVREVERVARAGVRSVKIPITNARRPYNRPEYEPLWAACAANDVVLALHAFSNAEDTYPEDWGEEEGIGGALAHMALSMADGQNPVALLISSGALERHPELRFVVVECGAGWLAWLLYVLDEQVKKKHMWIRPTLRLLPSEYFRRQGFVTFSDDPVALNNLRFTGAGTLLWGSDYPHDEGTFPHSREVVERIFQGVSEADRRAIVRDNAARLYGFE
jgi:predicted TIM-barrel fold metal-dependent hydrolase